MSDLTLVYSAPLYLAHLLESLLGQHGIHAVVVDPHRVGATDNPHPVAQVMVAREDLDVARGIARLFDKHVVQQRLHQPAELSETVEGQWHDWPTCIRCGARRTTACPVCATTGNDFAQGYYPAELLPDPGLALLLCPTCDEAFLPEFLLCCEHCGIRFSDGIDTTTRRRSLESRIMRALGVAFIAAFLIALWWLSLIR